VDNVVLAKFAEDNELYDALTAQGTPAQKVGDVKSVRNLRAAVTEGADLGLILDRNLRLNANRAFIADAPATSRL